LPQKGAKNADRHEWHFLGWEWGFITRRRREAEKKHAMETVTFLGLTLS